MRNQRTHILPRLVLAGLALLATLLLSAPSAMASEACPNERLRQESNINPTTHEPYDMGLPECRAYEMVSPLEKQQHDAIPLVETTRPFVAPDGSAIQWTSQGDYAGAENYQVHSASPTNPYVAQRDASGWVTRSTYPPPSLIEDPTRNGTVFSPGLTDESVCGNVTLTEGEQGPIIRCALREVSGEWVSTPEYTDLTGSDFAENEAAGASRTGEDIVFYGEYGVPFLSADTSPAEDMCPAGHCGGIYEEAGVGTTSPELRLVNVDNSGEMIGPENTNAIGGLATGSGRQSSDYQAISETGSKIFFTATPTVGVATVYARVNGTETVAISGPSPSECTTCNTTPEAAEYQGAAADGSKVFFTTSQQLLNSDTDATSDLYEYDFSNSPAQRIVQVSGGGLGDGTPGAGAEVGGVVSISEDGSHVYFMALGVLTTLPNGLGQTATKESENLYAYDTDTGETKFVATLLNSDRQLWGETELNGLSGATDRRLAQTTPDGRYLVFDSFAKLITAGPEADNSGAQQVYRYDFQTGNIIRISTGHEGFANNGNVPGFNAVIGPANDASEAASPTVNDSNRAISETGETIVFVSAAQLQSTDAVAGGSNESCDETAKLADGRGCNVYEWHNGTVSMISDGQDPVGVAYAGMSATGADIFFETRTQLVGQDTDSQGDIYDARIDGGFAAPTPEPSCSGEACQGTQSSSPTFGTPGSQFLTGGGNQTAPPFKEVLEPEAKPESKSLTRAQKLAKALKSCKKDRSKAKRQACEKVGRMRYRKVKGKK